MTCGEPFRIRLSHVQLPIRQKVGSLFRLSSWQIRQVLRVERQSRFIFIFASRMKKCLAHEVRGNRAEASLRSGRPKSTLKREPSTLLS